MEQSFAQAHPDGVLLSLKVQPRSSRNEIGEVLGNELRVKVTAPPVDAAANEALIKFLAAVLDCPKNRLQLIRGNTSRHKTIKVLGFSLEAVLAKLSWR